MPAPRQLDDVRCPECDKAISVLHIRQHIDYAHARVEEKREEGRRRHKRRAQRVKAWWER